MTHDFTSAPSNAMNPNRQHSRHHAREIALQILYRYEANQTQPAGPALTGIALAEDLKKHFEHFQVAEGVREFASEIVMGTLTNAAELDLEMEKYANNWKISRMAMIDRNLLRMAMFEMTRFKDIPASVTIDEAVELAKQFGTADTSSFVNAILDSFRKVARAG